jgi:hypothetical protein
VRGQVWELAGADGPAAEGSVIVDIDGVLVLAHSERQDATATWKKTFGHHPLVAFVAFVDHGQTGSREPVDDRLCLNAGAAGHPVRALQPRQLITAAAGGGVRFRADLVALAWPVARR